MNYKRVFFAELSAVKKEKKKTKPGKVVSRNGEVTALAKQRNNKQNKSFDEFALKEEKVGTGVGKKKGVGAGKRGREEMVRGESSL